MEPRFNASEVQPPSQDFPGYEMNVGGYLYWVEIAQRATFKLADGKFPIPMVEIMLDVPPEGKFEQQLNWRTRWLQDVALRASVELQKQELPQGNLLLSVLKAKKQGHHLGLSLLVDTKHQRFVQFNWVNLPSYASLGAFQIKHRAVLDTVASCMI